MLFYLYIFNYCTGHILYGQKLQMDADFQLWLLISVVKHVVIFSIVLRILLGAALLGSYHWLCLFHSSDCESSARKVTFGTSSWHSFLSFCYFCLSTCFVRGPALTVLNGGGVRLLVFRGRARRRFITTPSRRIKRLSLWPRRITSSLVDLTLTQEEVCSPA